MLHVELESVEFDEVRMRKRHRILCFFVWICLDLVSIQGKISAEQNTLTIKAIILFPSSLLANNLHFCFNIMKFCL
jgi:hypothetical protein